MPQEKTDAPTTPVFLPDFTIDPFTTATADIESWRTAQHEAGGGLESSPAGPLSVKAFTVRLEDMLDLVNRIRLYNDPLCVPIPNETPAIDNPVNAIRFYLGMKDNPNPAINPKGSPKIPCLVFLPVTGFVKGSPPEGSNPAIRPIGGKDVPTFDSESGAKISACYDFSFPCPGTCADA